MALCLGPYGGARGGGVFLRARKIVLFIDNLLVRIRFVVEVIWWTGLAPWEFEFPFPGSLISTFLVRARKLCSAGDPLHHSTPNTVEPMARGGLVLHDNRGGRVHRGTSLTRKRTPLSPYCRPMPRVLGGS